PSCPGEASGLPRTAWGAHRPASPPPSRPCSLTLGTPSLGAARRTHCANLGAGRRPSRQRHKPRPWAANWLETHAAAPAEPLPCRRSLVIVDSLSQFALRRSISAQEAVRRGLPTWRRAVHTLPASRSALLARVRRRTGPP